MEVTGLHFYAAGNTGTDSSGDDSHGHWDRIHKICEEYYDKLNDEYDDIAEMSLQLGFDIQHPSDAASSTNFPNSFADLVDSSFTYNTVMSKLQDHINVLLNYAKALNDKYSQESTPQAVGVLDYLGSFCGVWGKEAGYRLQRRRYSNLKRRTRFFDENSIMVDLEEPVTRELRHNDKFKKVSSPTAEQSHLDELLKGPEEWYFNLSNEDIQNHLHNDDRFKLTKSNYLDLCRTAHRIFSRQAPVLKKADHLDIQIVDYFKKIHRWDARRTDVFSDLDTGNTYMHYVILRDQGQRPLNMTAVIDPNGKLSWKKSKAISSAVGQITPVYRALVKKFQRQIRADFPIDMYPIVKTYPITKEADVNNNNWKVDPIVIEIGMTIHTRIGSVEKVSRWVSRYQVDLFDIYNPIIHEGQYERIED